MKGKEKIFIIVIIVLLVVLFVISFLVGGKNSFSTTLSNNADEVYNNAQNESKLVNSNEKKDFVQIDVNKFIDYLNESKEQIILVARPTCQYCQIAEPIIQYVAFKYNLDINYLNTDNFSDEDSDRFINSNEMFQGDFGTPTLLIVKENSIVDSEGLTDYAHYVDFFTRNDFIKE